jgi:malate synthase
VKGTVTKSGLVNNVEVSVRYLMAWLAGSGAVAINNLMEDAATVEISRSQIWQQVKNSVKFEDTGEVCTTELVNDVIDRIYAKLITETCSEHEIERAINLFREVSLAEDFLEFITPKASELIDVN